MTDVVRVTRTLRAPVTDVFDAWTDASRLKQWLNPGPGTLAEAEADPVVGGVFRFVKLTADGVDEVTGRYLVVDPPHRRPREPGDRYPPRRGHDDRDDDPARAAARRGVPRRRQARLDGNRRQAARVPY